MSIKKASLSYRDGKSDKVYEVEIVYLSWDSYEVNYFYGKRGSQLRKGSKTKTPISLKEAEQLFDNLVKSKLEKGYRVSKSQEIDREALLQLSSRDRQKIVDEIKRTSANNFVEELKEFGFDLQQDLVELDLSHADLRNADLRSCNFYKTHLIGANLRDANLQLAILEKSKIDETTQIDPKWRSIWDLINLGGQNRDLVGIDLSEIEIGFIDWYDDDRRVDLSGLNLEGANLSNSNWCNFDFSNANLKNANLSGSEEAFLDGAFLVGADLSDTYFDEGYFDNATCINANFSRAAFGGEWVHFRKADCTSANFQQARFTIGSINGANFSAANFEGATNLVNFFAGSLIEPMTEIINFQNAILAKTDLKRVDLAAIKLIDLRGVSFDESNLEEAAFSGLDLQNTSFRGANLKGADFENCNLENADFTGANLTNVNFQGVDLSQVRSWN